MDPTYNPLIPYSLITVLIPPINPLYLGTAELISFYLKTFSLSVGAVHNKASINPVVILKSNNLTFLILERYLFIKKI